MKKTTCKLIGACILGTIAFAKRKEILNSVVSRTQKFDELVSSVNSWSQSAGRVKQKTSAFMNALSDSGVVLSELTESFEKFEEEIDPLTKSWAKTFLRLIPKIDLPIIFLWIIKFSKSLLSYYP